MKALLCAIQERLFGAEDTVCLERARLLTQAWAAHEAEPAPLRRARGFAHVLANMTLDLDTNPVFAGNTSSRPRAWMLVPEHGFGGDAQVFLEHDGLRERVGGRVPDDLVAFWRERSFGGACGVGHLAVDLQAVAERGLAGVLADLDAHADAGDEAQRAYREAMAVACRAVVAWARRYADAAEEEARRVRDPLLAWCHLRVARACRHVPEHPARDLFEGLQAIALVHLAIAVEGHGMSVSIGLPDRALVRFSPEAAADPDGAADLVAAFLLKIAANSLFGRGSKTQAVTVGGADAAGRDVCNAVTRAFLDGFDRVAVSDPHLFLRCHPTLADDVRERAAAMLARGRSMPLLINDAPTVQGFVNAGVAAADAADYCVIGCNELGIPGRLWDSAVGIGGAFNDLELLSGVLLEEGAAPRLTSMAALLACLEAAYEQHLRAVVAHRRKRQARIAEAVPTPFTSALMAGAPARGQDLMAAMPYRVPCIYTRGLANAANALAAIEQAVFTRGELSMEELIAALRNDFADEAVRERLTAAPKWGNDDERADRWAAALVALRERALDRAAEGHERPVVCHVVRSLNYLDGARLPATPDGRRAGEPVGDSLGPVTGTAVAGPTALLNSVLKLDAAAAFAGGTNLNLTLPGAPARPKVVQALAEGFFARGGQELQINVLDAARLREAQAHPERFADLVVRVAGLSARFVELSKLEQDELIARAEHAEGVRVG